MVDDVEAYNGGLIDGDGLAKHLSGGVESAITRQEIAAFIEQGMPSRSDGLFDIRACGSWFIGWFKDRYQIEEESDDRLHRCRRLLKGAGRHGE